MKTLLKRIPLLLLVICLLCPMTAYATSGGSGNMDGGAASVSA